MAEKKNDKIIRNRRIPITFVGVVFILIFVYLVIQGVLFLRRNNVQAYNIGSAASDQVTGTFRGMILRDEVLVGAEDDGYISYYATSGERLKNGSLVCKELLGMRVKTRLTCADLCQDAGDLLERILKS